MHLEEADKARRADLAEPLEGPFVSALGTAAGAAGVTVVAGVVEAILGSEKTYNTAVAIRIGRFPTLRGAGTLRRYRGHALGRAVRDSPPLPTSRGETRCECRYGHRRGSEEEMAGDEHGGSRARNGNYGGGNSPHEEQRAQRRPVSRARRHPAGEGRPGRGSDTAKPPATAAQRTCR